MTAKEFNNYGFKINDKLKIILNDGTERVEILYSSSAYVIPERENYITKEIIPREPAKLLYNNYNDLSKAYSINLEDVQSVELIK
ncbi:hypothetical protein [uncultured Nonlabens sp.]|uniref:hypothetical protein n=1 Tax=uncultured Nonlabens sp. TaxID=859306 RepID=UPI0030D93475|tara:strand:- start:1523 stop:1777 length:255 start_codon:yes stop_codon:yes gene_type:complete